MSHIALIAVLQIYDLILKALPHSLPTPHWQSCCNKSFPQGPNTILSKSLPGKIMPRFSSVCSAGPRYPILGMFTGWTLSGWKSSSQPRPGEHDCQIDVQLQRRVCHQTEPEQKL